MARPTKLDETTIKKLEEAFIIGASIKEACFYADITTQTFYNWKAENPELFDRFEQLQLSPIFKARKTLVGALETNPNLALKYLERKLKTEFGEDKEPIEIENKIDSVTIEVIHTYEGQEEDRKAFLSE